MAATEHPINAYRSVLVDGAQLIDVREPAEFAEGTLPEAVNIPMGELPDRVGELDPTRAAVMLCRSGNRSGRAAEYLSTLDFDRVINLTGGMLALDPLTNSAQPNQPTNARKEPTMLFTQYYLDCLSQASYLIGDRTTGRAVVVDPRRDIDEYVRDAESEGMRIELVLETHFHADFLSGHLELAAATGAEIGFSSVAETEFESRKFADGERYSLGEVELQILHTPGHTPESISIVVWEHANDEVPYGVLTGDTLFIGDVGRPDLLASIGWSRDELADKLYDSLHDKLLKLPDPTKVYPAHGAGSACGKNLSTETWSTIGEQRVSNYAVLAPDRKTFLDLVTEGQPPAPEYFVYDAMLNRQDRELLDEEQPPEALSLDQVDELVAAGAMLLDGREPEEFAHGHLEGAVNVGLNGRYAEYAGSVIPSDVDIVLFVDPGFELEAKNRLARIGFDRVVGYLDHSLAVLADNPERAGLASRLTVGELDARRAELDGIQLVDVRNPGEVQLGSIDGAVAIPISELEARASELDARTPTVVFCAGGYRSSIAASLLRATGFNDVSDLVGGFGAWSEAAVNH